MKRTIGPTLLLGFVVIMNIVLLGTLFYYVAIKKDDDKKAPPSCPVCPVPVCPVTVPVSKAVADPIETRDRRALSDPLYPPLNRTDYLNAGSVKIAIDNRDMYVRTKDTGDQYRLLGYLTNESDQKDAGGNTWKLMGRDATNRVGEYYMIPSNTNYDIKIMLTNDIIKGQRITDIYSIPSELAFSHPMLLDTPYKFVENPKTDFSSKYI